MYQFILVTVLLCTNTYAKVMTLDELKTNLFERNLDLKAGKYKIESYKSQVEHSRSKLYPSLGVELGHEDTASKNHKQIENFQIIYGKINLFNGFQDMLGISRAKSKVKLAEIELKERRHQQELDLEKLFYQYLYLNKKKEILAKELSRSSFHIRMVKKRLSSNIITETDLLEFKLYKKKLISLMNYVELEVKTVKNEIMSLSGLANDNEYVFKGSLPHLILKTNYDQILKISQESHFTETKEVVLKINQNALKEAEADWYPKIDFKLEHGILNEDNLDYDENQTASKFAIMASWELNLGKKNHYKYQEKLNSLKNVKFSQRYDHLKFKIKIKNLYDHLKMLEQTILSEEENAQLSLRFYKKTLKEYQKGIKDSGALSSASKDFAEVESRVYQLKFNYILARLKLEKMLSRRIDFKILKHKRGKHV